MSRSSRDVTLPESQTTVDPLLTSTSYADCAPTFDSHENRGAESIPIAAPLPFRWLGAASATAGTARARTPASAAAATLGCSPTRRRGPHRGNPHTRALR